MTGYFAYPFKDDEVTGFFGGYRRPTHSPSLLIDEASAAPVSGAASAPETEGDVLTYSNGTTVTDWKGRPFPRPLEFDMQKNLSVGDDINASVEASKNTFDPVDRDFWFAPLFPAGAPMDYKRPNGVFRSREPQYRPISYYNYGVMSAKVGYDVEQALYNAGLYNRLFGGPPANRMASMARTRRNGSGRAMMTTETDVGQRMRRSDSESGSPRSREALVSLLPSTPPQLPQP